MIITRTPYRIGIAGGGTDFPEYFRGRETMVINAAINKHLYVLFTERVDSRTRVAYFRGAELVREVNEVQHEIVRAVLQKYGIAGGVEIATIGELPADMGLGSSSAVTVGLVHAVRTHLALPCTPALIAEEAVVVERDMLMNPATGYQDSWAVSFPGLKAVSFGPGDEARAEPIALSSAQRRALERNSLLVFTQATRPNQAVMTRQAMHTQRNSAALDDVRRLAVNARALLDAGPGGRIDFASLGAVLDKSWEAKKRFAEGISNARIDRLYRIGIESGAWGGKLLGAGNGGFLFFLAPPEKHAEMLARMGSPVTFPLQLDDKGTSVVYAA